MATGPEPRRLDPESRQCALDLIVAVRDPASPEAEADARLTELERLLSNPHVSRLIFHHVPELSAEDVIEKALEYKPFAL